MKNKLQLASLFLLALVSACSGKKNSAETKSTRPIRIGFVLATLQEERYAKDKRYFEQAAQAEGAEVIFASANNSEQEQLSKVENILSQGIQVLVVQPVNSNAASTFVTLAHKEGVKVIAYDRVINNAALDLYVTQDSYKVGVLEAEAAAAFTNNKGNYVILKGEAGHSVANDITRGVIDTLAKFPEIKVVVSQAHAGWSGDLAMKTVENALTVNKNKIDAVLANNSGMANGAVQALAEQKLTGKVFVAGADADLTAVRNIVNNRQQFEVLKAIQPLAEAAARAAVQLAKGATPATDGTLDIGGGFKTAIINTPVFPVTIKNLDEVIISSGFHSKQDVYNNSN